jgi:hydroxyacylglutathione hydrolase
MKRFSLSILLLLLLISSTSSYKFLSKSFFENQNLKYVLISSKTLKKYLTDPKYYIIDTREMATIALGYIPNTILIPSTMFSWLGAVVPDSSNVIIITDNTNKYETINSFIKLGKYKLIGYCIYDDIVNSSSFNIQQIVYNPNTYDSIQKIVDDNQNIIDIREVAEYINTGVIQQAKLIPLNTFKNNYVKVPKEGNVYVFCKSGGRAVVGMSYVKRAGYTNKFIIMRGGMDQAIKEGYPTVPYVE